MVNLDYLYNPDAAKPLLDKNYFVDKKLGFQVIENGTILPHRYTGDDGKIGIHGYGGIVDGEGNFIIGSHFNSAVRKYYTPPPNQFNTALKPSFILVYFFLYGGMSLLMTFGSYGFSKASS